ncbi:MAG: Gfo/Idh/MocA family oxidoreductase [Spirochaetes bacterium]|nr:Gfo/Idh/MocA family oxidoreductase [Spirochaetota bacterium]
MAQQKPVRLGIIGTGGMANTHATQYKAIPGVTLVAACDIDDARAKAFCEKHGIPRPFTDAAELLRQGDLDGVSIVTPDASHKDLSILAVKAGKHVLCEKPLALTAADAKAMAAAAKKAGVVNMVNFSYRNWPVLEAAAARVAKGDLGELRHVEASYLQSWLASKAWGDWRTSDKWLWRLSTRHGSKGALGDVGVHIFDFATLPAGPIKTVDCKLKTFPKAKGNRIGAYRLDANDSAMALVEFENGALGEIHTTRFCPGHANRLFLRLSGTKGSLEIDSALSTTVYKICVGKNLDTNAWEEVTAPPVAMTYARFVEAIRKGKGGTPDFARGAQVQAMLDGCFASAKAGKSVRVK